MKKIKLKKKEEKKNKIKKWGSGNKSCNKEKIIYIEL